MRGKMWLLAGMIAGQLLAAQPALAGGLDALGTGLGVFLTSFVVFVIAFFFVICVVGIAGTTLSLISSPFQNALAGMLNYFLVAGFAGGGIAILGTMGVVQGAIL